MKWKELKSTEQSPWEADRSSAIQQIPRILYMAVHKSLARPERKQANVSVRMAWISFGALPCRGGDKKFDDSRRLDVVEIARVSGMLLSLVPSWSG